MNEITIRRVYRAEADWPSEGIRRGDQLIELADGRLRPRLRWEALVRELDCLSPEGRLEAIHEAADFEAAVIDHLVQVHREAGAEKRQG
jgi:hypothetical protein